MALGDELGNKTVDNLDQHVRAWLNIAEEMVTRLLRAIKTHRIVIQVEERKEL